MLPSVDRCGFVATCSRDGSARVWAVELPLRAGDSASAPASASSGSASRATGYVSGGEIPAGLVRCIATIRAGTGWLRGI